MSRYAGDRADQGSRLPMLDTSSTHTPHTMPRYTSPESYCSSVSSEANSLSSSPTQFATPVPQQPCSSAHPAAMSEYSLSRTTAAQQQQQYHHHASSSRRTSALSPTLSISPIPEHGSFDIFHDAQQRRTSSSDEENANYDIKIHLTDLLNCETVRQDSRMRLWVQARLMEAELELKRQRRRRGRVASLPAVTLDHAHDDVDRRCSA